MCVCVCVCWEHLRSTLLTSARHPQWPVSWLPDGDRDGLVGSKSLWYVQFGARPAVLPAAHCPLGVQVSTVLWMEGDRDGHLRQGPTHPRKPDTPPSHARIAPPGRNHSWEGPLGTELCHPGEEVMCVKSVCSSYSFQGIQFQIFFCWNFSAGLLDFHKGSLIRGWLSKSLFSRDSWFTAKGGGRAGSRATQGFTARQRSVCLLSVFLWARLSQIWCWWWNQSQMGL